MEDPKTNVTRLKRPEAERVTLTAARITKAMPRANRYTLTDAEAPGLWLRVEPTGAKAFYWRGALGKGREGRTLITIRIGDAATVPLYEARAKALRWAAMARDGQDPRGDAAPATMADALDTYEAHLIRTGSVRWKDVLSAIRRELKAHLKKPLADLDRAAVAQAVERLEAAGKAGAAGWLRKSASAFLGWAADSGRIAANPLTGWRRPAATRAQRLDAAAQWTPTGPEALGAVWSAFDASPDDRFTVYLRLLLLTGMRRGELAAARWSDVDLDAGTITIRPENAKTGVGRSHPLGPVSHRLLSDLPPVANPGDLIFPGRNGAQMSGWTQRLAPIRAAGQPVELHGLRRAYRTVLSELGVSFDVAEALVGHKRQGLHGLYDKSALDAQRRDGQRRWEEHLSAIVG